jgi:uncharacterized SAM-binding protein YcdF (DUF218 family)
MVGFGWFLHRATTQATLPLHADGIVALTGGAERIETALHLLAEGRADRLLVSGVGGMADFAGLARRAGIDPTLGARVTLGRGAASTHGNATETAAWTRTNGVRSLLVVTAFYHMPRALAELGRAMPEVRLYPVPVLPPSVPLRLLAAEYAKYLAAASGLTDLAARTDAAPGRPGPADAGG